MYRIENRPDMTSVLSTLVAIIREHSIPVDRFLQQIEEHQIANPFQYPGNIRIGDTIPDEFLQATGIRRIVLDHVHFGPAVADRATILGGSSLIEFADWAETGDASCSWQTFYSQVIQPLNKRDFQFIFHLGDTATRRVFEVDEVLDIIGDYSTYGHVTLILDSHEADDLWCQLNGLDPASFIPGLGSPGARDRYIALFDTMGIDSLVVLYDVRALHFSREGQFHLGKESPVSLREIINGRNRFSAGYQLGLLLRLDATHCTTLGLVVSGGYTGAPARPASTLLLEFIRDWLRIL